MACGGSVEKVVSPQLRVKRHMRSGAYLGITLKVGSATYQPQPAASVEEPPSSTGSSASQYGVQRLGLPRSLFSLPLLPTLRTTTPIFQFRCRHSGLVQSTLLSFTVFSISKSLLFDTNSTQDAFLHFMFYGIIVDPRNASVSP